jgi:hypothetical protein
MTSWQHFQGISSSIESGVWPNYSRNFFGWFLLALANFAVINDDIVLVRVAVDLDQAEREAVETHARTPWTLASRALLRRDGAEGGPAGVGLACELDRRGLGLA